jgi:hypothetical protein
MTEPRDIIQNDDSSKSKTAYIYRTVNDRTLSEEYNMRIHLLPRNGLNLCVEHPLVPIIREFE